MFESMPARPILVWASEVFEVAVDLALYRFVDGSGPPQVRVKRRDPRHRPLGGFTEVQPKFTGTSTCVHMTLAVLEEAYPNDRILE